MLKVLVEHDHVHKVSMAVYSFDCAGIVSDEQTRLLRQLERLRTVKFHELEGEL